MEGSPQALLPISFSAMRRNWYCVNGSRPVTSLVRNQGGIVTRGKRK